MLLEYLVFALVGKLLIFLWQVFPLSSYLASQWKPLEKLFGCDLCLGVWIYWFLALFFAEQINPFLWIVDSFLSNPYLGAVVYVMVAFLIGAVTSFIVHIFSLGWNAKFQVIEIK